MALRETARGIGIRALILVVGIVVVGGWLALKIVSASLQLLLWLGLILIAAGVIGIAVHRIRRRV